jgi:hypothetical protein
MYAARVECCLAKAVIDIKILKSLLINLDWNYLHIEENKQVVTGVDLCNPHEWRRPRRGQKDDLFFYGE